MTLKDMHENIGQMENAHFQRLLNSQELFIRGDRFFFGKWAEWRRAPSQEEADRLLQAFCDDHP